MCNQTVGLMAAELEQRGLSTVCLQLLQFVAEKVRPPRSLWVPYPHGYTLGRAGDQALQLRVMSAALKLLEIDDLEAGEVRDFV